MNNSHVTCSHCGEIATTGKNAVYENGIWRHRGTCPKFQKPCKDCCQMPDQCCCPEERKQMTQDVEKWITELKAAGWKRHATIHTIWISPWGAWYQGPHKAWQNIEFEAKVNDHRGQHGQRAT